MSALTTFVQHAIDITKWLTSKAWASDASKDTARWLVSEQMGKRIWAEGVLLLGGKSGRRGGDQKAKEIEADLFGKAVARINDTSSELVTEMADVMREATLEMCFPSNVEGSEAAKQTISILARLPTVVSIASQSGALQGTLDDVLGAISATVIQKLVDASTALERANSVNVPVVSAYLAEVLVSFPKAISGETIQASLHWSTQARTMLTDRH
jgi:hypothetical protein